MEKIPKSTLRSNRKPLSDCTNTQNNLLSSKLISQTPIKPPFVTPIADKSNQIKKNENPNFNSKLDTSIGSNNSPISDIATPKPRTPLSRAGDVVSRKYEPSATQTRRQDEKTRKSEGKSTEAYPIAKTSASLTSRAVHISPSTVSGTVGRVSRPPTVENLKTDEQKRKDKGKMVVETPIIHISTPSTSPALQSSSSAASANCYRPGPDAVHSHTNQDKPITGASGPTAQRSLIISSSEVSGDMKHGSSATRARHQEEQMRKDKGKSVVATPITRASTRLTSRGVQISSSAASDVNGHDNRPPIASNHDIDEQKRKQKGKMVVETPMIYISTPSLSPALQPSSSGASGNCYGPSAVHSHKQDAQAKKDNTKIGQEMPNNEESDPTTPRSLIISSSEAAATDDEGKSCWIVYNQRRPSERKKRGVGSISLPFSCPPDTRTKKKREELDDGRGGLYSGSRTDPLPLPKKKRRAKKNDESLHAMPQDEVAKLKSYFAEIDEFELPEEVASESELE